MKGSKAQCTVLFYKQLLYKQLVLEACNHQASLEYGYLNEVNQFLKKVEIDWHVRDIHIKKKSGLIRTQYRTQCRFR